MTVRFPVAGEPSYLSSAGTGGLTVYCHVTPLRSGALDVITVVAGCGEVAQAGFEETSRTKLRGFFEGVSREFGVRMAMVPADYVAWRIQRAAADHRARSQKPIGAQNERVLDRVVAPVEAPLHPTASVTPDVAELRVRRSLELLAEPELRAWLPPPDGVESVMKRAGTLLTPEGEDRERAVLDALHTSIDGFYTDDERAVLSTQLRDVALVFAATRRPELALDAIATAAALEAVGRGGGAPHAIPFVFGMFYKFARMAGRSGQRT